ncbi:hypothetical protein [Parasphingopyxis marina]|uniref:Uncharacterized protein n=1 Tax=Parasphingopyxis marina TaxID=2761622 RepID=A0A842I0X1_9SPHN|nr:hypothetical protein [Parasphingopyxis marina]MBC2778507.1 hypothetical protein [Parasphingopyxis marina]
MSLLSKLFGRGKAAGPAVPSLAEPVSIDPTAASGEQPDPAMTARLRILIETPPGERDEAWQRSFFSTLWTAAIEIPSSEAFTGPDGFRYLRLDLPATESFVAHNFAGLAQPCLEAGSGAVLFAHPDAADPVYVIPMGVIESLVRYRDWRGDPVDLEEAEDASPDREITIAAGTKVLTGTPSVDYLSREAAHALDRHLKTEWKLPHPRVLVMTSAAMQPSRSLVFNARRSAFKSDEEAQHFFERISWFIPPSRTVTLMPEDWSEATMTPLAELAKA